MRSVEAVRIGKPVPLDWVGLSWYVATVKPGNDQLARDELEAAGFPVFMLEGREARRFGPRNGRRKLVDYPVFPGYLFVADVAGALDYIFRQHESLNEGGNPRLVRGLKTYISGYVARYDQPERVNGAVMQSLFMAHEVAHFVHKSIRDSYRSRIKPNDIVQFTDGWLRFYEGIVDKFNTRDEVEILTEIFGRKTRVVAKLDILEKIDV